jgi:hypothetical protein
MATNSFGNKNFMQLIGRRKHGFMMGLVSFLLGVGWGKFFVFLR